jgi:hypothetical protein
VSPSVVPLSPSAGCCPFTMAASCTTALSRTIVPGLLGSGWASRSGTAAAAWQPAPARARLLPRRLHLFTISYWFNSRSLPIESSLQRRSLGSARSRQRRMMQCLRLLHAAMAPSSSISREVHLSLHRVHEAGKNTSSVALKRSRTPASPWLPGNVRTLLPPSGRCGSPRMNLLRRGRPPRKYLQSSSRSFGMKRQVSTLTKSRASLSRSSGRSLRMKDRFPCPA